MFKRLSHWLAGIGLLASVAAVAQPTVYCVPTSTIGTTQNDYIDGIALGTINNQATGSAAGASYNDYSAQQTDIARGATFQLIITGGPTNTDRYAAWIDYNRDTLFTAADEKLGEVASGGANAPVIITFTVPNTASLGLARLRIRVARNTTNLDPCTNYTRGETEDYTVNILASGGAPPIAAFTANPITVSVGSPVSFTDNTTNNPTSWNWTFAGGTPSSSSVQNPTGIVYSTVGCYAVTLTATNASGSNTLTQTCYIIVTPVNPYCTTLHQNNCTTTDNINAVTISGTSLSNVGTGCGSLSGTAYSNFAVSSNTTATLYQGGQYQMNVTTAGSNILSMWIDYDQNGTFDAAEWTQITTASVANLQSSVMFQVPANATSGQTRMRIRSRNPAGTNGSGDACTLFGTGETEDYTVTISAPPAAAPVANFSVNNTVINTGGSVNFTDLSVNVPTGWNWTFTGAATSSSTVQNPTNIVYNTPGCFAVKLRVTNAYGVDSLTQTCYVTVQAPQYCSNLYSAACTGQNNLNTFGITGTTLNNANSGCGGITGLGYTLYGDTANATATLNRGTTYTLSLSPTGNARAGIWIDYNQNATFETNEYLAIGGNNIPGGTTVTANLTIPNTASLGLVRMRVRTRAITGGGTTLGSGDACTVWPLGETEDYVITLAPQLQLPPVANWVVSNDTITPGAAVNFTDLSTLNPTSWSWTFTGGTPATSNQQNPQNVVFSTPGCNSVSLIATNAFGSDTLTLPCGVYVTPPQYCSTLHQNNCSAADNINAVVIQNTTLNNTNTGCGALTGIGYTNYSVTASTTAVLNRGTTYNFSVTSTAANKISIWIDFNQNTQFETSEWFQVASPAVANIPATIAINIPSGATLGQTRMRVRSRNAAGSNAAGDACTLFGSGETEDYTITIGEGGNNAPVANFTSNFTSISPFGVINYSDLSTNSPTSWAWSFPGGVPSSSTQQNPTGIVYSSPGCYNVTLIATNAFGSDTLTQTCFITVSTTGTFCNPVYTTGCSANNNINRVRIAGTPFDNNNTGCTNLNGPGYSSYPATGNTTAQLNRSQNYTLQVASQGQGSIAVWFDWNHNNVFETTEYTSIVNNGAGNQTYTVSILIPNSAVAGPTGMRVRYRNATGGGGGGGGNNQITSANACTTFATGESEDYTVNIFDPTLIPVANFSASPTTVCPGGSVSFTDLTTNNPTFWNWSFPGAAIATSNVQNPTVVYPTSGTYAVTLISGNGNGSDTLTQTALVNVLVAPTVNAGPDVALCLGAQTTLSSASASQNATLVWSPSTGLSSTSIIHPVANPTATTVYTLAATLNGCTKTDTVQVTVNQTVAMAMGDTSICLGGSAMLHASGGTSYLWSPATGLSSATAAHPIASPSSNTTYTVTVTANGCTSTAQVTVNVQVVNANAGSDVAICLGSSTTLNATGGTLFDWSPATGLSDASIANPIANPTATTTYTVTVTEGACSATDAVVVTVNNTIANAGSDATICAGSSTQLSATGGTSYSWSPAAGLSATNISNPISNPTTTTAYTVTVTANGCTATDEVVVNVNTVVANAGSDTAICAGGSTQLSASGGTAYQWSPAAGLSSGSIANPTAAPSVTTTYTVTAFANGCSATDEVVVTVNNTVANAGLDATICVGNSTTLNASGGTTYSWNPATGLSDANIANPIANPSSTTTYTVTATANGCSSTDQVVVTVNSAAVSAGADQTICVGGTAQLNATGNGNFSWSPASGLSNATSANPFASPSVTSTYTVTITENGCTATDEVVVNVNVVPANAGADVDVCRGSSAQLSATGGTAYSWSPAIGLSATNVANPTFSGAVSGTYTVTVTSNGCTGTDEVVVTVLGENATAGLDITVCPGNTATMQASGGTSYSWSPATGLSGTNIANPTFNGTAGEVYLVSIGNGSCIYVDTVSVTVGNVTANAGADQTICAGAAAQLLASGGTNYNWSPATGLSNAAIANPVATPTATTTYVVTASSGSCLATDTITVVVLPAVIANAGSDAAICLGGSTQLSATGGATYSWSPSTGLSDANIANPIASPGVNTNYVVTVSNAQCSATDTISVSIQTISLNVSGGGTICAGSSVQLSADAGISASYNWTPSASLSSASISNPIATPSATTTYTVTAVNGACSATNTVLVTVTVLNFSAGADVQVCAGGTVVLGAAASGSLNYSWSPTTGLNNANIAQPIATPAGSMAYYVTVTNNICTATDTVQVTVNPLPVPVITQSGNSLVANFPAASVQNWSMGGQIQAGTVGTNPYNPSMDGSYTVTVVDNLGCIGESAPFSFLMTSIQAMDAQRLNVYPNPVEDHLRVEAEASVEAELSISIVDLTGRTVVEVLQGQQVVKFGEWISVQSLDPGIYLVRFSMKNQVVTRKFTKL